MFELALGIQIGSIVFCAIGTFFLYSRIDKAVSKNLLASSLFAMIFGVGYLMEMVAQDEGQALYALTTQYIGLCCVGLFFAIYATEMSQSIKVPRFVWALCFLFNLAAFIAVFTSGYHNYYYRSRVFVQDGLFPHIEATHTPWFCLFMLLLLAMLVYSAVIFIVATVRSGKKRFYAIASVSLFISIVFVWSSFAAGFNGYEPVSAIVCLGLGTTSFIMMSSKNSAILNKAYAESYMESSIGQIIVTHDGRFIECNKIAKEFFPQLADFKKGQVVEPVGEGIVYDEDGGKLHVGDRCYAVTRQKLEGFTKDHSGWIISLTDVTALETERSCDGLTGLLNRQAYFDKVDTIVATHPERVDVLMSDLNALKMINDTQGHAEGDRLIKDAAACFKKAFTDDSYIFRLGGDEFSVISTAGEKRFEEMLINLAMAVDEINVGRDTLVSLSCGTAFAAGTDDFDIAKLMKQADDDMYFNKKKYYEINHIERRRK